MPRSRRTRCVRTTVDRRWRQLSDSWAPPCTGLSRVCCSPLFHAFLALFGPLFPFSASPRSAVSFLTRILQSQIISKLYNDLVAKKLAQAKLEEAALHAESHDTVSGILRDCWLRLHDGAYGACHRCS